MSGKIIVLAGVAILAVFAIACSSKTVVQPADQQSAGVSVSGQGTATGVPDVAVLTLGVQVQEDTVSLARERAAAAMDAMIASLRDGGVAEEDVQTTRFSVQPNFDFQNGEQILRGYIVENTVTARIRSIDDTGDLIDGALEVGGNLARVQELRFTIDDPSALEDEARQAAMADAQAKAQTLADAAGVDLGKPRAISESGGALPVAFDEARAFGGAEAADIASTPIEVGELDVIIYVNVVYGLED